MRTGWSPMPRMRLCSALSNRIWGKASWEADLSSLEWQIGKTAELTYAYPERRVSAAVPIVEEMGYRSVYDWKELRRWGIPESSLPNGSIFVNRETECARAVQIIHYLCDHAVFYLFRRPLLSVLINLQPAEKKSVRSSFGSLRALQ